MSSAGALSHHLSQWRTDFCSPTTAPSKQVAAQEVWALKKANQQLQRELTRKEKALAEAAALLVLQKKFNAYLEGEDE